jgi:dihydroorotase
VSRLVIKGGQIVDPSQNIDRTADIGIEDGVFKEIAEGIDTSGCEVFDAAGLVVCPGFIDMHVHLREPGFEYAETIESGSRAAAVGGFTSICCMPNTDPINDNATVTSYIVERARTLAKVNVFPIGAITKDSNGEELASIASMKQAGIVAISDDGRPVMNARLVRRAMEFAAALDLPLIEHCEDLDLSANGDMHEGMQSTRLGLRGIPRTSEDVMVARDIILAEVANARYHVAHISSKKSVELVADAKRRNLKVTAEATPHHFALSDSDMRPYDGNYKMKPPLRESCDVEAVTRGLLEGTIDAIATDHAPHPGAEKMREFERCPFGIIGLETAVGVALERLYHTSRASLPQLVRFFTSGPASVVLPARGALRPGAAADVTVLDLDRKWTYNVTKSRSKSQNTPFQGHEFRGGPVATIVGGEIVWKLGD